jgi:Asp-tRNA(Asn)/Glu-tRNA(Gln) amidotransferase A subunit family amidase
MVASNIPSHTPQDYTQFTRNATFEGLRIGVPREIFFDEGLVGSHEIIEAADDAIAAMKSLGAVIRDPADFPNADAFISGEALLAEKILLCTPPSRGF